MVSKYDLIKYLEKRGEEIGITYNKEDDTIYDKNGILCSADKFLKSYRLATGQAFTSVYSCPATLIDVLRCDKCGTVIFSSDNYEDYDNNLKCPVCTNYETPFEYWTKEEIYVDEDKTNTIKMYEEFAKKDHERYLREKKRGKTDREITKHTIRTKMYRFDFVLGCDDISKSYFKGLRYEIIVWKKDSEDSHGYIMEKHINIPLSWSQLYYRFIYKQKSKRYADRTREVFEAEENMKEEKYD